MNDLDPTVAGTGTLRIIIQAGKDGTMVVLHLNRRIVSRVRQCNFRFPLIQEDEDKLTNAGDDVAAIVRRLDDVAGLTDIDCQAYVLMVSKALVFDWRELLPRVLVAIETALGATDIEITEQTRPGTTPIGLPGIEQIPEAYS
jgi:hypothetical protein